MIKRIGFLIIIAGVAVAIFLFINRETDENVERLPAENQSENQDLDNSEKETPTVMLKEIFKLAEEGKVPDTPIVAGDTSENDVRDLWGEAEQKENIDNGYYIEYPNHDTNVGIENGLVFDVRSFQSGIKKIHLTEIKDFKGEPDKTRYYEDESHDQIILVYNLGADYQIKWILPKPTEAEPDPATHHISVYTETKPGNEVADVVEDMSLDEKIGQMIFGGISGTEMTGNAKDLINTYKIGGVILFGENIENPAQTVGLLNDIKSANAVNRLPVLLGVDEEGGSVTRMPNDVTNLPTNERIGNVNDTKLSYEIGQLLGQEVGAFGFNLDFAPVMDVNSNPDNPVIGDRSFGDNPEIVSNLGIQTLKGIQSENIIPVIKHFPGHGDTAVDSHLELPKVNKSYAELTNLELIPFKNAIEAGADVTMIAHILLEQIDSENPATMSKEIISGILRDKLGFNGVVISDDMTMKAITNQYDIGKAAVKSVQAGSDIVLVAHDYDNVVSVFDALKEAVGSGDITEERINESVHRIIELKEKYDIDDEKSMTPDIKELNEKINEVLQEMP